MERLESDIHWLTKLFGVNPDCLDLETWNLVEELGQDGVDRLIKLTQGMHVYRNTRITKDEGFRLLGLIERLLEEGCGEWAPEEVSIGGDKPSNWIDNEIEYLTG